MTRKAHPAHYPANQTLLIDADDTLWENNIYFERAIASFISYLDHRIYSAEQVREHLNQRRTRHHRRARLRLAQLPSIARHLLRAADRPPHHHGQARPHRQLRRSPSPTRRSNCCPTWPRPWPSSPSRHRLILVTKGDHAEQTDKLRRSGLAPHFSAVEVLPEKHHAAYRSLSAHHGCEASTTWMIGNSPKSDINPAFAAGLNAIFIPHDLTWALERENINQPPDGCQLLELARFADLTRFF